MRAGITLVFLAGVLLAQQSDPPQKGAIRGAIHDSAGLPVAGIIVEANLGGEPSLIHIGGPNGTISISRPARTATDKNGNYVLAGLDPGNYFLRSERDSQSSAYRQIKVDAGQEMILNLTVPVNPSISGRVVDRDGEPQPHVQVWVLKTEYDAGAPRRINNGMKFTAKDGSYSFDFALEANRRYYLLAAQQLPDKLVRGAAPALQDREPIAVSTYYPSAIDFDLATPIVLQPGEQREKVDIKIATAPYYCVDGKVPGPNAIAIQDSAIANVQAVGRAQVNSDDDGQYRVCGLSPGRYRLSTRSASTEFAVTGADLHGVNLSTGTAQLRLQTEWEHPEEILDPSDPAALRKFATALGLGDGADVTQLMPLAQAVSTGAPGSEAQEVKKLMPWLETSAGFSLDKLSAARSLFRPGDMFIQFTSLETGRSLNTSRSEIPAGDYLLSFHAFGRVGYPKEITYNDVKIADRIVRILPGSIGTLHILYADDVATISVNVADSDGKPVPDASVVLIPEAATSVSQLSLLNVHGMTDQNGSYTSPPLVPGKYKVLATTQIVRWAVPEDLERVMPVLFQATDAEVAPNGKLKVAVAPVAIY